jgi:hypothetical protein
MGGGIRRKQICCYKGAQVSEETTNRYFDELATSIHREFIAACAAWLRCADRRG